MKNNGLLSAISEQKKDPGLKKGALIAAGMDQTAHDAALDLADRVRVDLSRVGQAFSGSGPVGLRLNRDGPTLSGIHDLKIPSLDYLGDFSGDPEKLMMALFDPRFQDAIYHFQLLLARSDLKTQQDLIKKFATIDWSKFNTDDNSWLVKTVNLVKAGKERCLVNDLNLEDVIPLMMVPTVLNIITIASGYAWMMDALLAAYMRDKDFIRALGTDDDELLEQIDVVLEKIKTFEAGKITSNTEVVDALDSLKKLMEMATLVSDLTNRSPEAQAQRNAGVRLAKAKQQLSEYTLEGQEAYLQQFMMLNQILISNQIREGRMGSAMAALGAYAKTSNSFVLLMTALQVYLLTASSVLKTQMGESSSALSRQVLGQLYSDKVNPLRLSVGKFVSDVSRVKTGESRRQDGRPEIIEGSAVPDTLPAG